MERITSFVNEFIPQNLPEKKYLQLKTELENHLCDKCDFYREIGYSKEESINKAISDFGTDEEMKEGIIKEFEELYSEKNMYAVLSFVEIMAMHLLYPSMIIFLREQRNVTFVSFCFILFVCGLTVFARIRKYRKMLLSVSVSNLLGLFAVPMFASYTMGTSVSVIYNLRYLTDMYTPFSSSSWNDDFLTTICSAAIILAISIYCLVLSLKIKRGEAKNIQKPKKKVITFISAFSLVMILSLGISEKSFDYGYDYRVWFDPDYNYITSESDGVFEGFSIGDSYDDVKDALIKIGYTTADEYEKTLDKTTLKQFRDSYEKFNFADGYEVWFETENEPEYGSGFVGIKQKDGIVTAKAVGNLEKEMQTAIGSRKTYGCAVFDYAYDMPAMLSYVESLSEGAHENEVISRITDGLGFIYSKRFSLENNAEKHYYRVYTYQASIKDDAYSGREFRYIELFFENGKFKNSVVHRYVES